MGLFGRRKKEPSTSEDLLAAARAASIGPFRLVVADVFAITGRGVVATGRIDEGAIARGQTVTIVRDKVEVGTTEVAGVEIGRKLRDSASAGEDVGLLMRGISRDDIRTGDVLTG